ncbi:MAG: hypothetical protein RL559_179 [Pseudomonadota bacterium]
MNTPRLNDCLDELDESDVQRLRPHLRAVNLEAGERLQTAGEPVARLLFPISCLIAFSRELSTGISVDTALIGPEGVVGLRGLIQQPSLHEVQVVVSGLAYEVRIADFSPELQRSSGIQRMCMRAGTRIIDMISTELACSRFHAVEARLAKWILVRHDRGQGGTILATHQSIADSLGVRREAVTNALQRLEGVRVERGCLQVHDRAPLEAACCECYFSRSAEHAAQLSLPFPARTLQG